MKYLSLILLLLFITIVSTCTGSYKREGLDNKDAMIAGGYVNVGNRSGNCAPSIIPGKNNFATKELASQFCFDWNKKGGNPVCTAIEEHAGKFTARGCSDDAIQKGWCKGFPKVSFQEEKCNTEQGGTTWFYKKPSHPAPPPSHPAPPPHSSTLCCTGWQQTLNCDGHGPIDKNSQFLQQSTHGSHKCNVALSPQVSGYCICKDGSKKYFDCGKLGGKGQPQNCDDACKGISCQPKSPLVQHINNLVDPVLGTGSWNTPLPVQHAKFLIDKSK